MQANTIGNMFDTNAARAAVRRRRVGGRWAVSWQGYVLLYVISLPLSNLVVPAFANPERWFEGLIVATVAYAAAGVVLALASVTVLRHRQTRPVRVPVVVLVGGIAWLVRSWVFALYLSSQGLVVDTSIWSRLLVGFALGALLVPSMAWLLATIDEFRSQRRRLVDELVQREVVTQQLASYLTVMREELQERVGGSIAQSFELEGLTDAGLENVASEELAPALERLAVAVRQTSHDLVEEVADQARRESRIRVRDVLLLTARRPYSLRPILFFMVLALAFIGRNVPFWTALLAVVVAGAWVFLVAVGANWKCGRNSARSMWWYVISVAVMALGSFVVELTLVLSGRTSTGALTLGLVIVLPFELVMLAGGIARGVNVAEEDVLTDMRASVSEVELRTQMLITEDARLRREISVHLHGTIAANVTAASMRLRTSMSEGDVEAAMQAYAEARRLLDMDFLTPDFANQQDLDAALQRVAESWTGIASIELNIHGTTHLTAPTMRNIVDVVTEAISNAVRHGDAEHITVDVHRHPDDVSICVRDDGRGGAPAAAGLGVALFERVGSHGWSLVGNSAGGNTLTITMQV